MTSERAQRSDGMEPQGGEAEIRAPEFIRHQAETSADRVSEDAVGIVQATMDRVWQAAGHRRSDVHAGELV